MNIFDPSIPPEGTRIIRTARTSEAMNEAVKEGFRPLVKPVVQSPHIRSKVAIFQHRGTGEVYESRDYRDEPDKNAWKEVFPWTAYYPYQWTNPFAAYLIPADLEIGDTVWLEDLIEDVVGSIWNQGNAWRLDSCLAVWNGKEFDLLFDEQQDRQVMIG